MSWFPAAARRHLFLRSLSAVPAGVRDRTFKSQPFDPVVIIKMGIAAYGDDDGGGGGGGHTCGCGGKNEKMVGF